MVAYSFIASVLGLAALTSASDSPTYTGWTRVWQDTFAGQGSTLPNENNWNIINAKLNVNNELETYKRSTRNVQLSGGNTLQLVPWNDNGDWSSGRIESKYTFTPTDKKITRVESSIRFGGNAQKNKQGIWPAFWMLGDSIRHGTSWPACGELDIMEVINGQLTGHGTMHCDRYPGGICNEGNGIGSAVSMPNQDWHTWRIEIDRRNSDWKQQSITWYFDGKSYQTITGSRINNQGVWNSVAHSSLFIIFNVAVGGGWPGNPNADTLDGYGAMLEASYAAHYVSN
ncbi:hypothetical protein VHEMI00331 [[Torrubiella] hemipterigena]|uniref:GH16 domain-containing protein n=1 Tax=[Torrubiella] hemipterigena TaxID=1531966 RepID=A0A0A1SQ79_9HYPO|nr:hypothetical protein VHEMI00331 [[Torrubiella] hemipterigena]